MGEGTEGVFFYSSLLPCSPSTCESFTGEALSLEPVPMHRSSPEVLSLSGRRAKPSASPVRLVAWSFSNE